MSDLQIDPLVSRGMADCSITSSKLATANSTQATTAVEKVLGTVELFEHILQFLPFKDLLHSQRVSRQWKATIDTSLPLQQALFFQPAKSKYAWLYDDTHTIINELGDKNEYDGMRDIDPKKPISGYQRKVPLAFTLSPEQISSGNFHLKKSAYLHPLFKPCKCGIVMGGGKNGCRAVQIRENLKGRGYFRSPPREESSWKKMLLTQPPLPDFIIRGDAPFGLKFESRDDLPDTGYIDVHDGTMELCDYDDKQFWSKPALPARNDGLSTIGEIVGLTRYWDRSNGTAVGKGDVSVHFDGLLFPTAKEVAREVVWNDEDDWYYGPLFKAGFL
jgi:hypothetical protein